MPLNDSFDLFSISHCSVQSAKISLSLPKELFLFSIRGNKITSLLTVKLLSTRAAQWNLSGNNITKDEGSSNPFFRHNSAWDSWLTTVQYSYSPMSTIDLYRRP